MNKNIVVFVNPFTSLAARYGPLALAGGIEPPFGLCYLAAQVRNLGYETVIVDTQALRLSNAEAVKRITSLKPGFVGFTACTTQIKSAAYMAKTLKRALPSVVNIIGGPHVSSMPEFTMHEYPEFDIAVVGEGEQTLCEILSNSVQGNGLTNVNGLVYRKEGKVISTKPRSRINNLDSLASPAFDLLPYLPKHYRVPLQSAYQYPSVSLVTSRGCPNQCIFCDRGVFGNHSRFHSARFVIDMIKNLRKDYGIKSIMFEDDNFVSSRERLYELLAMLQREKIGLNWACNARIGMVNETMLREMKNAGCWQILYGIESGSQKILDFLKKNITREQIKYTLQITKKSGIQSKGFIMFGNPLETRETLQETIDFINNTDIDDVSITYFTPYPGSEIFGSIKDYGRLDSDFSKMSCFEPVFFPNGLNSDTLENMFKLAYRKFYFRKKIILAYIKKVRSFKKLWMYLVSALSLAFLLKKTRLNFNKA